MKKHIPVKTERLDKLSRKASVIIQKNAEAVGTMKMLDGVLESHEKFFQSDEIWALRNVIRNIESAIDDAADIKDSIGEFKEMENV